MTEALVPIGSAGRRVAGKGRPARSSIEKPVSLTAPGLRNPGAGPKKATECEMIPGEFNGKEQRTTT